MGSTYASALAQPIGRGLEEQMLDIPEKLRHQVSASLWIYISVASTYLHIRGAVVALVEERSAGP